MEKTDKCSIAQTWKSKFHVSIFTWLMLLAPLLTMLTWEFVGFGIFTLGFSFYCVSLCRSASSGRWSGWVSAAGCSSVSLCHKQELLHCSWCICKGHFSMNFTHSELECIPAGRSDHDEGSFWQHCTCIAPGLCLRWRGNAVAVSHLPGHSLWTGPGASLFFFPSRFRRGPKT